MDDPVPRDETATTDGIRRRSDGEETHAAILAAAMRLASIEGLGTLTIGRLARELDISKSGVFAHFGSKGRLQQETIDAAEEIFAREVLEPSLAAPEGLSRLESLCEAYLSYVERGVFPGGCFFAQLLGEFDAQSGPIHDRVEIGQRGFLDMLQTLIESATHQGQLDSETDPAQMAFELYASLELANFLSTLYRDQAYVERGRHAVQSTIAAATPRSDRSGPGSAPG